LTLLVALLTLFVAAANVGNILFAQGAPRRAEFALRAALGAPRGRLIGQLLIECFILCGTGGALGLLVSMWGLDLFVASMPERIADRMRIYSELRFDSSWTLVAVGVTLFATAVAGLWPALRISDTRVGEVLKEQENHATSGRGHRRVLRGLVTGQIAIALALLTGATCVIVDLVKTERQRLGFELTGVLSARITREESDDRDNVRFFTDLSARLRAIPGVDAVGFTSYPPLSRGHEGIRVTIPGRPRPPAGEEPEAKLAVVDGSYFKVSGTELLEGNIFTSKDGADGPAVALLSRRAAETFFPGQGAIAKTIELLDRKKQTPCTIIGIVDDIAAYRNKEMGMIYRPFAQEPRADMVALLRGPNPDQFDRSVRDAVHALDHRQPVETRPLRVHVDEFLWAPRVTAYLIAIPAALSMLLSMLGVYGLAAYSVAQRRYELGIRAALGASPRALVALVMREALWIAGIGGSVGLGLALFVVIALGRAEVQGLSPVSAIALGIALVLVVLFASYGPARRAARASPSLAMR
jgi:putative ABC transport system permease protein